MISYVSNADSADSADAIENERVPRITINHKINLFVTEISILVI